MISFGNIIKKSMTPTPAPSAEKSKKTYTQTKYRPGCARLVFGLVSERNQANKEQKQKEEPKPPLDPRFEAAV
jgi:hypothetical protein